MRKLIPIVLILLLNLSIVPEARAAFCRDYRGHRVCVQSIKRSAKYHWQYGAKVNVDGIPRPLEWYDCRQKIRVTREGNQIDFQKDSTGELICSVLEEKS